MWHYFKGVSYKDFVSIIKKDQLLNKFKPEYSDSDHQLVEVHKNSTHKSVETKTHRQPARHLLPVQGSSQSSAAVRWLGRVNPTHILLQQVLSLKPARLWTTAAQGEWMKEPSVAAWSLSRVPGAVRGAEKTHKPHDEPPDSWRSDPAVSGSQVTFPKHA